MKTIKFKFVKQLDESGFEVTKCTHIQVRQDGKFTRFEPHTDKLLEKINNSEFIIQE